MQHKHIKNLKSLGENDKKMQKKLGLILKHTVKWGKFGTRGIKLGQCVNLYVLIFPPSI